MTKRTIKTEEIKKKKELFWNIQVYFSLHRLNPIGQNASSFDWLNRSQLGLENIRE